MKQGLFLRNKHIVVLSFFVLVLSMALLGCSGSNGSQGAAGAAGANGAAGSSIGTVSGTVTGPSGALAGVVVTDNITSDTATTDSTGKYSLSLPIGTYTLTFTLKGYTAATTTVTVAAAGNTSSVSAVTMSEATTGLPSVVISSDSNEVGYGNTVNLTATVTPGTNGGTVKSYAWSVTPPSAGSAQGLATIVGNNATAVLTMMPMNNTKTFNGAFDGTVTQIGGHYYHTAPQAYNPVTSLDGYTVTPAGSVTVPADPNFVTAFAPQTFVGIPRVMPINADTRGTVSPKLVVTDSLGGTVTASMAPILGADGKSVISSVALYAAAVQPEVADVALGEPVYLNSGIAASPWAWTLTVPSGSKAVFKDSGKTTSTVQYPMFVPDVVGAYTVQQGAKTTIVYVDTFKGVVTNTSSAASYTTKSFNLANPLDADKSGIWFDTTVTAYWPAGATSATYTNWPVVVPDSNCTACHANNVVVNGLTAPDKFTPWALSAHATFFARGIDGITGNSGTCLTCHTTGYDLSLLAINGGFDDVQAANSWVYPANRVSGNWGGLFASSSTAAVAKLSNIQCENCHGPQANNQAHISGMNGTASIAGGTRVDYSSENCAVCHSSGTGHHYYSEWQSETGFWQTPNSSTATGGKGHNKYSVGQNELQCGCHNAQSFAQWVPQLAKGIVEYDQTQNPNVTVNWANPPFAQLVNGASVSAGSINNLGQPVTCTACHDPHDATNPNQLRVYDTYAWKNIAGISVSGFGKGAICTVCHNSGRGQRCNGTVVSIEPLNGILATGPLYLNELPQLATATSLTNAETVNTCVVSGAGLPQRSPTQTFLREDSDPYQQANPVYSATHDSTTTDIFAGRGAFFMQSYGTQLPMLSKHAAVKDTCAGCHMTLNPTTHLSHGAPAVSTHTFIVDNNGAQTLCSNCHSSNVTPNGIQGTVTALMSQLVTQESSYVMARMNAAIAAGNAPYFRYTAKAASTTAIPGTAANPYLYAQFTQVGNVTSTNGTSFTIYAANGTTAQGYTVTGGAAGTYSATSVYVQGSTGYSLFFNAPAGTNDAYGNYVGNKLYKAGSNYGLVSKDFSLGVHNPSFVTAILNNTIAAMTDTSK